MAARLAPERDRVVGFALDDRDRLTTGRAHEAGAFRCGHPGKSAGCAIAARRNPREEVDADRGEARNLRSCEHAAVLSVQRGDPGSGRFTIRLTQRPYLVQRRH